MKNFKIENNGILIYENKRYVTDYDFNIDYFQTYLKKEPEIIFDIGSYDGGDSLKYKLYYPNCHIYSFEPDKINYEQVKTIEKYNINTYNYVIANYTGKILFYPSKQEKSNYLSPTGSIFQATEKFKKQLNDYTFYSGIEIDCITIKDFCKNNNINNIDFVHVDVEGAAKEVILGLKEIRPKMMWIEVTNIQDSYIGATKEIELDNIMKELNYNKVLKTEANNLYVKQ